MRGRQSLSTNYLFRDFDIFSLQLHQREHMDQEIANADAQMLLHGDVDELSQQFAEDFSLAAPEIIEGAVSLTVDEAQIDVTGDYRFGAFGPGPHFVSGIEASYFVPFSGDRQMFKCQPSTFSTGAPVAEVSNNELKVTFRHPDQDVAATKVEFDRALSLIKQHLDWLEENCRTFNAGLPAEASRAIASRRARLQRMNEGVQSLGVPIRRAALPAQIPQTRPARSRRSAKAASASMYDVALSFAGENRPYVEQVATHLKSAGVNVFYDAFEQPELWGRNLIDHLAEIYGHRSRYVVMFISKEYVEKAWTTHERQHAQERALLAREEFILPARFDDSPVPGMTGTVAFQDLRRISPRELADLIVAKLRRATP